MARSVEGHLGKNNHEMRELVDYIQARDAFDWTKFIEELCDMEGDAEGPWDKEQWYCFDCVLALVGLRLRKWWIATKVKGMSSFRLT